MADNLYKSIAFERINKIHEHSLEILRKSFPFCRNPDSGVAVYSTEINNRAYLIKCLAQELSGLLKP